MTTLGEIHTAISLAALLLGGLALVRHGFILAATRLGAWYLVATLLAALTAFGLFRHGSFGPAHGLAALTLVALGIGYAAERSRSPKPWVAWGRTGAYDSTLLFSLIAGVTETLTRLPLAAPLLASPEDPAFGPIYGALLVLFVIGLAWQLRALRKPAGGRR